MFKSSPLWFGLKLNLLAYNNVWVGPITLVVNVKICGVSLTLTKSYPGTEFHAHWYYGYRVQDNFGQKSGIVVHTDMHCAVKSLKSPEFPNVWGE